MTKIRSPDDVGEIFIAVNVKDPLRPVAAAMRGYGQGFP